MSKKDAEDKRTKAITSRGQTADGEKKPVEAKPADPMEIDEAEASSVRGRTIPPPRLTMPAPVADPKKFPNAIIAIAEGNSPEEAKILSSALGLGNEAEAANPETGEEVIATRSPVRPDATMRTRVNDMIDEELGQPEEPLPHESEEQMLKSDTWAGTDSRRQETAGANPLVADLPLPESDEARDASEPGTEIEAAPSGEPAAVSEPKADVNGNSDEAPAEKSAGASGVHDTREIPKTPFIMLLKMDGKMVKDGPKVEVGDELIIGRDASCGLVIASPCVSRQHAEVTKSKDGSKYVIIDLESKFGVYVNDFIVEPDQEMDLVNGDKIRLGKDDMLGVDLYFLDPTQSVSAAPVIKTDAEAGNQPGEAVSAAKPVKEGIVTKAEQFAETQSLEIESIPGVANALPPADAKKADKKKAGVSTKAVDGGGANGVPPKLPTGAKSGISPAFVVAIITILVVAGIVGLIAYSKYHKSAAKPAIAASEVQPTKPAFSQFTAFDAVDGEVADQLALAAQAPEFDALSKMAKPEGFKAPKASPIEEFVNGTKLPTSYEDCFKRNAELDATQLAWCCANLHPFPGRLDELIRMTDCLIRLEKRKY